MNLSLEEGCGIYRDEKSLQDTCRRRCRRPRPLQDVSLEDKSSVYNTDLYQTLELGAMIECAETVAQSALHAHGSRAAPTSGSTSTSATTSIS